MLLIKTILAKQRKGFHIKRAFTHHTIYKIYNRNLKTGSYCKCCHQMLNALDIKRFLGSPEEKELFWGPSLKGFHSAPTSPIWGLTTRFNWFTTCWLLCILSWIISLDNLHHFFWARSNGSRFQLLLFSVQFQWIPAIPTSKKYILQPTLIGKCLACHPCIFTFLY